MSQPTSGLSALEERLATVLNRGTWLAAGVMAIGLAVAFIDRSNAAGLFGVSSHHVIAAGIVLLILLPVLRVVLMLIAFLREGDRVFGAIAALVLLIIVVGMALGAVAP